jgi:hypothetical protein
MMWCDGRSSPTLLLNSVEPEQLVGGSAEGSDRVVRGIGSPMSHSIFGCVGVQQRLELVDESPLAFGTVRSR